MKLDYRNEHLRKQVENNTQLLLLYIVMVLGSAILIFSGLFNTYREMKSYPLMDFDSIEECVDTTCKVEITEVPVELQSGYYMAKAGDNAIAMKKTDKAAAEVKRTGRAVIIGTLRSFREVDREIEESAKQYLADHGYYDSEKRERIAHYYFRCSDADFLSILIDNHPLGLCFGITILIFAWIGMYLDRALNVIKHIRPACGSVRYTRKEIDEQANSPESVWIYGYDIYVAPKILIGTNVGMTAVEYKDIKQLYFQEKWHREAIRGSKRITLSGRETHSYRDAFTYRLIVVTQNNRRLIMCDSMSGDGAALKKHIDEKCGPGVWGPDKESVMR